jgi:hypothetical protein
LGEEIATSANPLRARQAAPRRAVLLSALAGLAAAASGCGGGGERQDVNEPEGEFPVKVTAAKFPATQRLAETSDLIMEIENAGKETVPDLAVTVYTGDEKASEPFYIRSQQPGLADPSRPVWILEEGFPKLLTEDVTLGNVDRAPPSGAEAAQTDTYSFGPVKPGESKQIVFRLTPVMAGTFTVHYELAAGLHGKAEAVTEEGDPVEGEFVVTITDKPPRARVNDAGGVEVQTAK